MFTWVLAFIFSLLGSADIMNVVDLMFWSGVIGVYRLILAPKLTIAVDGFVSVLGL